MTRNIRSVSSRVVNYEPIPVLVRMLIRASIVGFSFFSVDSIKKVTTGRDPRATASILLMSWIFGGELLLLAHGVRNDVTDSELS